MDASLFRQALRECVSENAVREHATLAPFTTFGVGGPADWLITIESIDELRCVMNATCDASVPVTVLGGGSNVVVADRGVRGAVVRLHLTRMTQPAADRVRADAGVTMNGLVRWTIGRGLSALEAWAGTPGTVGGAVFGNAHFAGRNIGDLIADVGLMTREGALLRVGAAQMEFGYDTSRLKRTGEVLVWAEFGVRPAAPQFLRAEARRSLAHRKGTQPLAFPSAGCIFQNPDPAVDHVPADVPPSAGALIDRAGLKGHRIGGAMISPVHANFFVSDGTATAADIHALAALARTTVRERFGVELKDEIVFLGHF